MSCKKCEVCASIKNKQPSEKTMRAIEQAKEINARLSDTEQVSNSKSRSLDMHNAIVAAYVQSYEAGICFDSREEMLEELVVELTKKLKYAEEQLATGIARYAQ